MNLRKRIRTLETPEAPKQVNNEENASDKKEEISGYERLRDKRIKENMERLQKLGIVDLSLKLKSEFLPPKRTPKNPCERKTSLRSPLPSSGPRRSSSRLQSITPVSYSELDVPKKEKLLENEKDWIREGPKPEAYTEEHEKLLGTCKNIWTLFVDGYGKDGRRIYDQIKGKTCHQCRQKTLGHRTRCSKCVLVQGQFCGDCLFMRYGENVLEANQNPNWICPVCRGICNCSLCRQAKGWPATGALYRKISNFGFKSVAHYLIETKRSQTNIESDSGTDHKASAKRSLCFTDHEEPSLQEESLDSKLEEKSTEDLYYQNSENGNNKDSKIKGEKFEEKYDIINVELETHTELRINRALTDTSGDSIAGRLRLRRKSS